MISPILQTRRLRSREVRPFPGRACRWPVTVGEAEPVSHLPTRLPRTLLIAAYAKGWGPGRWGHSLLLCLSSRRPSSFPWLPCSLALPRQVPSPAEGSVGPRMAEKQQ